MLLRSTGIANLLKLSSSVARRWAFPTTHKHHIHTSIPRLGLLEFFDDPKTWGESTVSSGRPWRKDELRLKSNSDLHKLWYILLKERNMLMTMEQEHTRCLERMPNPERFEKVEESMENLMNVVTERNRADAELEDGEWIGPTVVDDVDALGRPHTRLTSEHTEPLVADQSALENERMWGQGTVKLLRMEREKYRRMRRLENQRKRFDQCKKHRDQAYFLDDRSVEKS